MTKRKQHPLPLGKRGQGRKPNSNKLKKRFVVMQDEELWEYTRASSKSMGMTPSRYVNMLIRKKRQEDANE